ncbi:chromate transporter, partial [Bacteroides sp. OttesenSCG-928-N06]|nr:chromate transporter [Bacteroides sp. OttesenSCG-928-N06]
MIYLQLFYSFFKIGLFGFGGGYAMLSLIQGEVVTRYNWLSAQEFTDIIAIMGKAIIYVNGEMVAQNFELFLPFEVDVTHKIKPGQPNDILVGVAKADLFDQR